jgi:23S rRNA (guanosine2251-2'-O)-methyltransferase
VYSLHFFHGVHAIEKLFLSGSYVHILSLFIVPGNSRLRHIILQARLKKIKINFVSKAVIDNSFRLRESQGIVAITKNFFIKDYKDNNIEVNDDSLFLILDDIKDSHNLGSCLRTAYLLGVTVVILSKQNTCGINIGVCKTSSGFIGCIPILYVDNMGLFLNNLKEKGVVIIGMTHLSDVSIVTNNRKCFFTLPCAVIFGSENSGLCKYNKIYCTYLLKIAMFKKGPLDNLNLAVSVGIVLYEITRGRF